MLESMYAELSLDELRIEYTAIQPSGEDEEPQEVFDALAYASELRRRLIEQLPLADEELAALGAGRADTTRAAIVAVDPALEPRVRVTEVQQVTGSDDTDTVEMKVVLTTGAGD